MDAKLKEYILRFYRTRCISNRDFLDDMQRLSRVRKCIEEFKPDTEVLLFNQLISLFNVFGHDLDLVMELKTEPEFWPVWYTVIEELGVEVPDGPRDENFRITFRASLLRNRSHAKILFSFQRRR